MSNYSASRDRCRPPNEGSSVVRRTAPKPGTNLRTRTSRRTKLKFYFDSQGKCPRFAVPLVNLLISSHSCENYQSYCPLKVICPRLKLFIPRLIGEVYRWLPISSGLTKLSFNPLLNRAFQKAPRVVTARLRDGTPMEVDCNDYHGRILYLFGSNDLKVTASAVAFSKAGDVFLDIGANYSTIGLAVSHKVGSTGAVHLFEPQKRIGDAVQKAIDAGHYRNVHLHRVGLLDKDGSFTIRGPQQHSGMATFVDRGDSTGFAVIEQCAVKEVSGYLAPLLAGRSFGAKLDIEGAEPLVMPWLLAQPNLQFLIFESAHNQRDLFDSVRNANFALYGLDRRPIGHLLKRVAEFAEMANFHDLIAVRARSAQLPSQATPAELARATRA